MLVIDNEANNSDHRPLTGCSDAKWDKTFLPQGYVKPTPNKAVRVRLDKADRKVYCETPIRNFKFA